MTSEQADGGAGRISVLGSSTIRAIVPPLTKQLQRHGFTPDIHLGGYGTWAMELANGRAPVFEHDPSMTVLLLDASVITTRLPDTWRAQDVVDALDAVGTQLEASIGAHSAQRPTVLTTIPLPAHLLGAIIDLSSKAVVGAAWRRFNARLLDLAASDPSVIVLDADAILTEIGPLTDQRMAAYAKIAHGPEFMESVARQIGHVVRSRAGRGSKALALDLDGTMWHGILSDDGIEGINLKHGPIGESYTAFRRLVRQLGTQGVLLTILSKNDAPLVHKVLTEHPDSDMKDSHFVAIRADWNPKPSNLAAMASDLNIGVDSFVFVDDSVSEAGAMNAAFPNVPVVAVDADEPALHVHALLRDGWFTTAAVTAEDTARAGRYRTELQRKELRDNAVDLDAYLADLGTRVRVFEPTGVEVARIAQITQRTNQFNLTTLRMDETDVRSWQSHPGRSVVAVECADRFGDHGIVGALFLDRVGDRSTIRNFALSCRILARGVESAILGHVAEREFDSGIASLTGWYTPSPKNAATATLYPNHGFTRTKHTVSEDRSAEFGSDTQMFVLIPDNAPAIPTHVDIEERSA